MIYMGKLKRETLKSLSFVITQSLNQKTFKYINIKIRMIH